MSEFCMEGNLIELLIQGHLRFKIEGEVLKEVSLKEAVNTVKRVIEQCFFDREIILVKEFVILELMEIQQLLFLKYKKN